MSKIHELAFDAEEIDELLDSVDKKTIYQDATQSEHGLMSTTDKTKLDALPTAQQIEGSLSEKVDKEEGKGLSENDYTDAEKESVASAYHKPQNGIPKTDLDSSVQTSLDNADTALQSFTETDPTVPSWAKQPNKPSYDYSEIGNTPDLSGFITKSVNDLTNYYLKSETYTKAEVAALIGAIQQFHYEIYATLPQMGQGNVLYLIGPTGSGSDKYEEYVYANNTWNKIGDTSIDLSGYVTTSALNTALADYTTTSNLTILLAGKADKVTTPSVLTVTEITQLTYTQVEALRQGDIVSASDLAYYVNFKTGSDCYLSSYDGNDLFFCLYYKEDNAWVNDGVSSVNLYSKADKVQFATPNNFAALNAEGNIVDSGSKASDFASASQGAKADTAYQKPPSGIPESDLSSDVQQALQKHFKGWYDSSSSLPAEPVVGDYAYVKGATSTDPAAIYECTTAGSWSDSGRTADTSNVQTFASGQEVNEVHIVNDLTTGGVNDVLSAKQGVALVAAINESGFSMEAKTALVNLLSKVAYVDEHGQNYLDTLYNYLFPTVVSIYAVFTQGQAVIREGDDLSTLKQYLVVTALRKDGSTIVLSDNDYVLSGTLVEGQRTITATYGSNSDTFTVTVSEPTRETLFGIFTEGYAIGKNFGSNRCYRLPISSRATTHDPFQNRGYIFTVTDSTKYNIAAYDIVSLEKLPTEDSGGSLDGYTYQCGSKTISWATQDSVTTPYCWIAIKKLDGTKFTTEELADGATAVFTYTKSN